MSALITGEFPFHSAFVSGEKFSFPFAIEIDSSFSCFKVLIGLKNLMGDEVDRHCISERGSKGLDEIEGKGGPAIGRFMEKADGGIDPLSGESNLRFSGQ